MTSRWLRGVIVGACALGLGGCRDPPDKTLVIAVNAPFSQTPYLANTIANGSELAVTAANARGVSIAGTRYRLKLERLDTPLTTKRR